MAFFSSGLLGNLKPSNGRGVLRSGGKGKIGQAIIRGRSKRAYSFEVYRREAVSSLWEVAGIYAYGRTVPAGSPAAAGRDSNGAGLQLGFIGATGDVGREDAAHDRLGHFKGHAFDVVLVLRVEQEPIRVDIERDLIELHNPPLNDLLRSDQAAKA